MHILGISGKRGVGKTALADHLVKTCGFVKVSFANELRRLSQELFPFNLKDLTDPKKKESPFGGYDWSPREFMIHFGEFMRFHDANYWIKKAISGLDKPDSWYVFDDLRYENEASTLKTTNSKIIRINRYESQNPYGKNLNTPSETSLDTYKFDYVINDCNNQTLLMLQGHTKAIIELYK